MRVLHVIPAVAARYGGPSEAVIHMCRALNNVGIEACLATTDADGSRRLAVDHGQWTDYRGIRTWFFPRQFAESFKYSRPLEQWLKRRVREFDVLHIHAVFSHSSIAAGEAAQRAGVPYLVRPLGSLSPWALAQRRIAKRILWHLAVRNMLRHAAVIHCTSNTERQNAESAVPGTVALVVPLGVELPSTGEPSALTERSLHLEPARDPYVLTLGRLHPAKGLELLLTTFVDLGQQAEFSGWRLVVVGDGDSVYVRRLKQLAQGGTGTGSVLFTGWLDATAKAAAIRHSSLLAMPSHHENFGIAAFEAMAHGVPVLVSSKIDLAAEIQKARAGWVTDLNPHDLMDTLTAALRDEHGRCERGARARALVANQYTWPAVADRLSGLYQCLQRMPRSQSVDVQGNLHFAPAPRVPSPVEHMADASIGPRKESHEQSPSTSPEGRGLDAEFPSARGGESKPSMLPLTVVVLTYQEELNLPACLASVAEWAQEIVVVDSGSRDRTLEIARQHGARVLFRSFETHSRQWSWSLDALRCDGSGRPDRWVLALDADQRVSRALRDELFLVFGAEPPHRQDVSGFYVKRRQIFRGRWIRHGGYYPKYLLKLFRLDRVRLDDRDLVDHHFHVDGPTAKLMFDLIEENRNENDINFWIEKHCRYALRLAYEEHLRRNEPRAASPIAPAVFGNCDQRSLWLKEHWSRLPLYVRPFLYFFYRYLCRLGFLDGTQGLIFHFLHACWFRFLVDVHIDQLRCAAMRSETAGARRGCRCCQRGSE